MPASKKVQAFIERASWIRKMFEEGTRRKARYGEENVFDFSLGNPNLEPPLKFKQVLRELADDPDPGQHAYMPNAGFIETRQAVANYLTKTSRQEFAPEDVVMTVGAGGAINVVLKTILDPGDEVIVPSPYFMEYNFYLDNHQGVPIVVDTRSDFSLDFEAIEKVMNERTRAVLINSPNNPSGKVFSEDEIEELGKLLTDYSRKLGQSIYLISDEPYRKIVYDGKSVPSVFNAYNECFVATSFSKDLSLAGERIGYAAVNPDIADREMIIDGMVLCNRILGFLNAPAIMQRAVSQVLEESVDISMYQKKRDMLCDKLSSFGYEFIKPEGAFYLFPRTPIEDDVAFVAALQEENILTVPGSGCGRPGYFRIAYCVDDRTIENALPGFERIIKKYKEK
ncbi:MAG: pyridoxal phosphate-dependent aminotransferase [Thermodesulfobacteriota bacterium]|nr:pyridoxal phosphate-dependent aminotransferase [Thermodesulfobacteriota bacterium]